MAGHVNTRYEMRRASYEFKGTSKCKSCDAPIEWWKTTHGKNIPYDPIAGDEVQVTPHWATCPNADGHRKTPAEKGPAQAPLSYKPLSKGGNQIDAMEREIEALCGRYSLRAVVLLHDGGRVFNYRLGIPAEDLRNEIISAANDIRNAIAGGR